MHRRHTPKIRGGAPPQWILEHTSRNTHEIGPRPETVEEWTSAGLRLPDLHRVRLHRLERVQAALAERDLDAVILYDPVNIRYATDSTNMSIWTAHNAVRFALVPAEGGVILHEFSNGEFLAAHSEVVAEIRPAVSLEPFFTGNRVEERARIWAAGIRSTLDELAGTGRHRIGVDTIGVDALHALEAAGLEVIGGMQLMEDARAVKHPEEIAAMRCAVASCEAAIADMRAIFEPGVTEVELWATMQFSNLMRFGEWVETRLLSSGARTNPWYQEASSKPVAAGEIMAFDTDMISAYGMCVDMSRSWLCGGGRPSPAQADAFARAVEMIELNAPLFVPGAEFRDITEHATYPDPDSFHGYTVLAHGVGMADEYPSIFTREQWPATGFDGVVEAGNVVSVEAFVGRKDGGEGVKLEQQYVITERGPELLTHAPMDLV